MQSSSFLFEDYALISLWNDRCFSFLATYFVSFYIMYFYMKTSPTPTPLSLEVETDMKNLLKNGVQLVIHLARTWKMVDDENKPNK
jgi:hypothetical protein